MLGNNIDQICEIFQVFQRNFGLFLNFYGGPEKSQLILLHTLYLRHCRQIKFKLILCKDIICLMCGGVLQRVVHLSHTNAIKCTKSRTRPPLTYRCNIEDNKPNRANRCSIEDNKLNMASRCNIKATSQTYPKDALLILM